MDPATKAVDNQGQALAAPCLGRSKVRSASLVRSLSNEKISWILKSPGTAKSSTSHDRANQSNICFFKEIEREKGKSEGKRPPPEKSRTHTFESYLT